MPSVEYKLASKQDLPYLTEKTIKLHQHESRNIEAALVESGNFSVEISNWLELELASQSSILFIITEDHKNIGFAHIKVLTSPNKFSTESFYGYVQSLWLDEAYRKDNIALNTVEFIESILREQGIKYYELNYATGNISAEKFWKKVGFKQVSTLSRKFL